MRSYIIRIVFEIRLYILRGNNIDIVTLLRVFSLSLVFAAFIRLRRMNQSVNEFIRDFGLAVYFI